jgi:prolipoprotein diacylglyceryl transferase
MTTTVIAYFPSPPQGVWYLPIWHLIRVPIRAYALFIIIGIVAALLIGDRRWEARGGERGVIYDIALWAVPFGLVGGRLYHLATDWQTYFGEGGAGPLAAARIWDGGLGIWGAVALGGVGAWIACRRRGIPLPAFGDAVAPGIVLAQAIGRLGNYFNQELYGRETTMPWGLEIFYRRDPAGFVDVHSLDGVSTGQLAMVVQPTFLYELLWNLVVFAALIYLDRRFVIGHGRLFALYVAGYCLGRFWVELLRDDAATHIAGIRINSFTATFVFIGAVVYFILAPKGREDPATLSGSVAEQLVPDSIEEDVTDSALAATGDEAVEAADTTEPPESTTAVSAAEEDAADEDAETSETTAVGEPEVDAAEVGAAQVDVTEEQKSAAVGAQPEDGTADPEQPAGDAETETVESEDAKPEDAESENAKPEDAESEDAESEDAESEDAKPEDAESEDAGSENAKPEDAESENAEEEAGEPVDDEAKAAHVPASTPTPEPADSTATGWGSRLRRLNPRSRR